MVNLQEMQKMGGTDSTVLSVLDQDSKEGSDYDPESLAGILELSKLDH